MIPANHPATPSPRIGVLLINLGTPDAPEPKAVRRYLAEFLSDRRVIELPQLLWQPILRGAVLTTRPSKSAHAYAQVWTDAGSPLAAITREQAAALQGAFGEDVVVDYAMRYGSPAIGDRARALKEAGCARILLAPLYPQYCAATTATRCSAHAANTALESNVDGGRTPRSPSTRRPVQCPRIVVWGFSMAPSMRFVMAAGPERSLE